MKLTNNTLNRKMRLLTLCFAVITSPGVLANDIDDYMVGFETTDCQGRIGMGLVRVTEINRINPHTCANGSALAQLMVRREDGQAPLEIYFISPQEVRLIREEVKAWQAAKRQQMLNTERIIID